MASTPAWFRSQLSGPHGLLAQPMAWLLNLVNGADYRLALRHLDLQAGEKVLELGFGGGVGVSLLLEQGAQVVASEPSQEMRERAYRRYAYYLARGRLEIWPHAAEELPEMNMDRALTMNTVYFWRDIHSGFTKLHRTVKKRVVLGIASGKHLSEVGFDKSGFRVEEPEWYAARLEDVGFRVDVIPAASDQRVHFVVATPAPPSEGR